MVQLNQVLIRWINLGGILKDLLEREKQTNPAKEKIEKGRVSNVSTVTGMVLKEWIRLLDLM